MGLSLQIYRAKPRTAGKDRDSKGSPPNRYLATWLIVVEGARAFFRRLSRIPHPIPSSQPAVTTIVVSELFGSFVAKEHFNCGADVVAFGDELYQCRREFNVRPTFIALRPIETGEEVVSNPTDLERSDLMPHWGLTYKSELK